jgi:hypothetical protein
MIVIYDDRGNCVLAHRDHVEAKCATSSSGCTNFDKAFTSSIATPERSSTSIRIPGWFGTVNQNHGADASDGLTFSIRVDGVFSDEFRKNISFPETNRASAPALWAAENLVAA